MAGATRHAGAAIDIQNTHNTWDAVGLKQGGHSIYTGAIGETGVWTPDSHDFGVGDAWTGHSTVGLVSATDLIGTKSEQVAPTASFQRAVLTLQSYGGAWGTFEIYALKKPWLIAQEGGFKPDPKVYVAGDAAKTLADLTGGAKPLDVQHVEGVSKVAFDVTAAVKALQAHPDASYGWLIRTTDGGKANFVGSGFEHPIFTPKLTVGDAEAKAPAEGPFLYSDMSHAASWFDAGWREPWNYHNHLKVVKDETGRSVLSVTVNAKSGVELLSRPGELAGLSAQAGKVYKIQFEARALNEIEGLSVNFHQGQPYIWHGGDGFPVKHEWTTYETQIKPQVSAAGSGLFFEFAGVGEVQFRWVRVTEMDDFDTHEIVQPNARPRGEMLCNPAFDFGSSGWFYSVADFGDFADRFFAKRYDRTRFFPTADQSGYEFRAPKDMFGYLTQVNLLELRLGETYHLRVRGQGQDGDAFAWIERPQAFYPNPQKFALHFQNGVAEVTYKHSLPPFGTLSIRPQQYFLLIEHFGRAPLTIQGVSLVEGEAKEGPAQGTVAVGGLGGPLNNAAEIGQPLTAEVSVEGAETVPDVAISVTNGRGDVAAELPVSLGVKAGKVSHASVVLPKLPLGWYQVSLKTTSKQMLNAADTQFSILPHLCGTAETKPPVAGWHINTLDPRQIPYLASLGTKTARAFEFGWPSIEPQKGSYHFPIETVDRYLASGISPMIILSGSPPWASSAPENASASASYPPRDIQDWRHFVQATATLLKGKVHIYEIWNEPNDYFMKVNPQSGKSLPQAYTELVGVAYEEIKKVDASAAVVAGVTAGAAYEFVDNCAALGMFKHCDVLSYHAYGEDGGHGAVVFAKDVARYHEIMKAHGVTAFKPIWDSESGYSINEGPAGFGPSMQVIQGLVGREAAGVSRYYIYTSNPRSFPGQTNFHMVTGFADRPIVLTPMLAFYNSLLGDAPFEKDFSDPDRGLYLYSFKKPDGKTVLAGWQQTPNAAVTVPSPGQAPLATLDVFGDPVAAGVPAGQLQLTRELRYFTGAPAASK